MQPPPEGVWGMPPVMLKTLRATIPMCRRIAPKHARSWKSVATGPTSGWRSRYRSGNIAIFRDPAVILIDPTQRDLRRRRGLDPIETANWFPKIYRKDYIIGLNLTGIGVDDPDAQFYENYALRLAA